MKSNDAVASRDFALMGGLALLGGILFFFRLQAASFWEDEAYTWQLCREWSALWETLRAREANMWLYYVLLHGWMTLFGESSFALRALSAASAALCAPALYWALKPVFPKRVVVPAALLLALHPSLLQYAQETRSYTLWTLATIVSTGLFIRIAFTGRNALWTAYGLTAAAGIWLHFYGIFPLAGHGAWALLNARRMPWKSLVPAWLLAALLVAPIPFVQPLGSGQTALFLDLSPRGFLQILSFVAGGRIPLLVAALLAASFLAATRPWEKTKREQPLGPLVFGLVVLLIPLAAAFGLSFAVRQTGAIRYFIFLLPAWVLLAARLAAGLPFRIPHAAAVALLLGAQAAALPAVYRAPKTPWDQVAGRLARDHKPGDAVLIENPFNMPAYVFAARSEPDAPPLVARRDGQPADAQALAASPPSDRFWKRYTRVWLIMTPGNRSFSWDGANRLIGHLEKSMDRSARLDLQGVRLLAFTARTEAVPPAPPTGLTNTPATLHLDGSRLADLRSRFRNNDPALRDFAPRLRKACRKALQVPVESVVAKAAPSPGGSIHDFVSLAYYYWPDPASSNGLPYISRDGEVNPENNAYDGVRLRRMAETVRTLAVGFHLTGNRDWGLQAARHLKAWFVDPETRMNPHLRYAQIVKGTDRGSSFGLIDSWYLVETLDADALLRGLPEWSGREQEAMQAWFKEYLEWLVNDEMGRKETLSPNNHGTWYDVQVASYALYAGDRERAKRLLESVPVNRIAKQIKPRGSQPCELSRPDAWSYVLYNLDGLTRLARLGEKVDVDLWNYRDDSGSSLRQAIDWLIPHVRGDAAWTYGRSVDKTNPLLPVILYRSAAAYRQNAYSELAETLPESDSIEPALARWIGY